MDIKKLTKPKLIELCKKNGLVITGNKSDLIDRLNAHNDKKKTYIDIKKDAKGNYVHEPTGLVFDTHSKRVFRTVHQPFITRKDIMVCKEHNFLYVLPETLDDNEEYKNQTALQVDSDDGEDDFSEQEDDEET